MSAGAPVAPDGRAPVRVVTFDPALAGEFRTLNLEWLADFVIEPLDWEYLDDPVGKIIRPGGEVFFALDAGRAIGTCAIVPRGPGDFELAKLSVTAAARGRGAGRALVDHAVAFARAKGAAQVHLVTSSRLVEARRLYDALGFVERPFPFAQPYIDSDVYMEMPLSGEGTIAR